MHTRFGGGPRPESWDLWERFGEQVYKRCLSIARDQADAEDLTTEVFLRVHDSLPRFEERCPGSTQAWLMTIAKHQCLNYLKSPRRRRTSAIEGAEGVLASTEISHERAVMIRAAVGKLAAPQRAVIGLFGQGYSYGDIASALEIGEHEVKSRVQNGLRNLRKMFGVRGGGRSQ